MYRLDAKQIGVLDHGYVKLIEWWGSDERIIEAARMSTNKGFQGWEPEVEYRCPECGYIRIHNVIPTKENPTDFSCPQHSVRLTSRVIHAGDERLLKYLYEHKHMTPFEMGGMIIEVQAPIFVFREWHRHRTQSYNEMSARYTPLPDVNYMPTIERIMIDGGMNKQAQSAGAKTTLEYAENFRQALGEQYRVADALYRLSLGAAGIPKELARLCIPVGRYSRMRASANLRNWLAFLTLRMDAAAQWEIRQYANVVGELIQSLFPKTWKLFSF